MRFPGHLLPGSIAALISFFLLPCDDTCAAGGSGDGLITARRLDASDHPELSLPTNLWRSAFLDSPEATEASNAFGPKDTRHPGEMPAAVRHATRELAAVRLDAAVMDCAGLSLEPTSDSAIADPMASGAISDWERAACLAADPLRGGSPRQGPSVISLIVGIVGLVIVVGAYVNSAR